MQTSGDDPWVARSGVSAERAACLASHVIDLEFKGYKAAATQLSPMDSTTYGEWETAYPYMNTLSSKTVRRVVQYRRGLRRSPLASAWATPETDTRGSLGALAAVVLLHCPCRPALAAGHVSSGGRPRRSGTQEAQGHLPRGRHLLRGHLTLAGSALQAATGACGCSKAPGAAASLDRAPGSR